MTKGRWGNPPPFCIPKRWFFMLRLVLYAFTSLGILGVLVVLAVSVTDTRTGPLPETAPGYRVVTLDAPHRSEGLSLHLWYPAEAGEITLIGQNALFYGFHARRNAPPDGRSLPLVVLSHGSGGNAERLGWIAARLAMDGLIVAAVNHPGTTSGDSLPARTVMPWERVDDLKAILDRMQTSPPDGLRPDMARVGALGFSLGGGSALILGGARLSKAQFIAYCDQNVGKDDCGWLQQGGVDFATIDSARYEQDYRDPRARAVVAVDPALSQAMTADSLPRLGATLIINLGQGDAIPAAIRADRLAAAIPDAAYLAIPGAAHFSFLARCSSFGVVMIALAGDDNICSDHGLRPRVEVQAELAAAIIAFFRQNL
jgi:predicted dienelactone hydrolase